MKNRDWYRTFFAPEFWELVAGEYTQARTQAEVDYLQAVLVGNGTRRVLDLGCGLGRHAIPLAEAGFEVVGLDVSPWALDQAAADAARHGISIDWHVTDLLHDQLEVLGPADAAISIQAFGWGSDDEQLRMLRSIRLALDEGGLLILDFTNPSWILRHYEPTATLIERENTYEFRRDFDVRSGRVRGHISVSGPAGDVMLQHDFRLYSPPEMETLLNRAGFDVVRMDADFSRNSRVGLDTRYAQALATPRPSPPSALAVATRPAIEPGSRLDLRWSPDEAEYLPPPTELLEPGLDAPRTIALLREYRLEDPYGAQLALPVLRAVFDASLQAGQVVFGSGASGILAALAGLATGGVLVRRPFGYPDLPAWAANHARVVTASGDLDELAEGLHVHDACLAVLDRPDVTGWFPPAAEVSRLTRRADELDAVIVVDEANANYLGPQASLAGTTGDLNNLVVVRSLSKGYGFGGLRTGFVVASPRVAPRVRELLPPLSTPPSAIRAALRLVSAGDVFPSLRARVEEAKPLLLAALEALGVDAIPGHPQLPWVVAPDPAGASFALLRSSGIAARLLRDPFLSPSDDRLIRVAVPLAKARLARLVCLVPEGRLPDTH